MDNRLSKLYALLKKNQELKISDVATELKVSTRTIYSDIAKLNELLKSVAKNEIKIEKGRIHYLEEMFLNIDELLFNDVDFICSNKRIRKIRIKQMILLAPDYFSSESLLGKDFISRNTFMADLKEIKQEWANLRIIVESIPFKGNRIVGDENKIRSELVSIIREDPLVFESSHFSEEQKLLKDIEVFLESFCQQLLVQLSDQSFENIVLYFWVTKKRIDLEKVISYKAANKELLNKEEALLIQMRPKLAELFGNNISEKEIFYLANKFSESSVIKHQELLSDKWLTFNLMIEEFISSVSNEFEAPNFKTDRKLYEGLLNHLRPAYKRALAYETIENPMFEFVLDNYYKLHQIVKQSITIIQNRLEIVFTDHEISFFTLFFAASFERSKVLIPYSTKIMIVCHAGISTSEILKSKISASFNVDIMGTFGVKESKKWLEQHRIDLIITTVPLSIKNTPVIQVSPYLSEEDIEAISQFSKPVFHEISLEKVLSIVQKNTYLTASEEQRLIQDLVEYLNLRRSEKNIKEYQPMLKEVLSKELIEVDYHAHNRDEAVIKSGELLTKNGLAKPSYIDGMLENVEVNGTYIVIAPGIAMPHARPETGALGIGFSIVTLKEPVVFGHPKNDPVRIIIGLCAIDHQTHLKALAELVEILAVEENVTSMLRAKNAEEIMKIIENE